MSNGSIVAFIGTRVKYLETASTLQRWFVNS